MPKIRLRRSASVGRIKSIGSRNFSTREQNVRLRKYISWRLHFHLFNYMYNYLKVNLFLNLSHLYIHISTEVKFSKKSFYSMRISYTFLFWHILIWIEIKLNQSRMNQLVYETCRKKLRSERRCARLHNLPGKKARRAKRLQRIIWSASIYFG